MKQHFGTFTVFTICLLLLFMSHCVVMPVAVHRQPRSISYSDLPFKTLRHFDRKIVVRATAYSRQSNTVVERVIAEELAKTKGARGIKNLKVRVFSRSWGSFQILNFIGYYVGIFSGMLGMPERVIQVRGDVY